MAEQGFFSAPYNFVPLADWVLRPPWSHLVSQDVPLSEGLCAEIGIRVTNDTPLLVGGPQSREPGRAREVTFFRHPDGTPALPGSSLRGMVRAVLEVLSFSRVQLFDDQQLAIRDVRPGAPYMDRMVSRKAGLARPLAHTGWLRFDRGLDGWVVQPCEHLRVAHELLAQEQPDGLGVDIQGRWERKNEDCRTVGWKYGLFNRACAAGFAVDVKAAAAPVRRRRGDVHIERREVEAIRAAAADGPASGCVRGRLVLTGQPMPRDAVKAQGKHFEFVFLDAADPAASRPRKVPETVYRAFVEVNDSDESHAAYPYLRGQRPHGDQGMPVFYTTDDGRPDGDIAAIGLAQLFKLPYPGRLGRYLPLAHADAAGPDFAETLFGTLQVPRGVALKTRVSFGDCRLLDEALAADEAFSRPTVQGSPHPGFFPAYLRQQPGTLITMLDPAAALRGPKVYPAQVPAGVLGLPAPPQGASADVQSRLRPLAPGRRFEGTVRLHNAMPQELGAVLYALTWGGRSALRHGLGTGKAFGLGQVKVEVISLAVRANRSADGQPSFFEGETCSAECRRHETAFEEWMDAQLAAAGLGNAPGAWRGTPQWRERLAMADPMNGTPARTASLAFSLDRHLDGFRQAKLALRHLPGYTALGASAPD